MLTNLLHTQIRGQDSFVVFAECKPDNLISTGTDRDASEIHRSRNRKAARIVGLAVLDFLGHKEQLIHSLLQVLGILVRGFHEVDRWTPSSWESLFAFEEITCKANVAETRVFSCWECAFGTLESSVIHFSLEILEFLAV